MHQCASSSSQPAAPAAHGPAASPRPRHAVLSTIFRHHILASAPEPRCDARFGRLGHRCCTTHRLQRLCQHGEYIYGIMLPLDFNLQRHWQIHRRGCADWLRATSDAQPGQQRHPSDPTQQQFMMMPAFNLHSSAQLLRSQMQRAHRRGLPLTHSTAAGAAAHRPARAARRRMAAAASLRSGAALCFW